MIVDDQMLFAEAIRGAIEDGDMVVVDVVASAEASVAAFEATTPDLVLMDIGLPDKSGLAAGQEIIERHPEAKIVALTALNDRATADRALRIGFRGYLTKDMPVASFMNAVLSAMNGHVVLPHRLSASARLSVQDGTELLASHLTPREREVLSLLVQGSDGRKAAGALGISLNTFRTHVQSILTKLQVHSRLEAAAFAVGHGLVEEQRVGRA